MGFLPRFISPFFCITFLQSLLSSISSGISPKISSGILSGFRSGLLLVFSIIFSSWGFLQWFFFLGILMGFLHGFFQDSFRDLSRNCLRDFCRIFWRIFLTFFQGKLPDFSAIPSGNSVRIPLRISPGTPSGFFTGFPPDFHLGILYDNFCFEIFMIIYGFNVGISLKFSKYFSGDFFWQSLNNFHRNPFEILSWGILGIPS